MLTCATGRADPAGMQFATGPSHRLHHGVVLDPLVWGLHFRFARRHLSPRSLLARSASLGIAKACGGLRGMRGIKVASF